jgi:hypothetical protein
VLIMSSGNIASGERRVSSTLNRRGRTCRWRSCSASAGRADRCALLLEGNTLITPEQPNGSGVDAFVATASAAEPLRVAIAGDARLQRGKRAQGIQHLYADGMISALDAEAQRGQRWDCWRD